MCPDPSSRNTAKSVGVRNCKFARVFGLQLLQLVRNRSHTAVPARRLDVPSDLDDNMFLECADAARADYLVTGNKKHFPRFWEKAKIITTREFIGLAAPHLKVGSSTFGRHHCCPGILQFKRQGFCDI